MIHHQTQNIPLLFLKKYYNVPLIEYDDVYFEKKTIKAFVEVVLFDILVLTKTTFDVLLTLLFLIKRIFYKSIGIHYNNNDSYYQCVQHDI